jgi:quercetin dioxygenase-like cupin family protein
MCLVATVVLAQEAGRTVSPEELKWVPGRTPGLEVAFIVGNRKAPGPLVYRVKFPPNFVIRAHTHRDERTYTVLSGTWYVGWGTHFDDAKLKALSAGSFYTEPAGAPHYVATKGEPVMVQITATGPLEYHRFVEPAPVATQ